MLVFEVDDTSEVYQQSKMADLAKAKKRGRGHDDVDDDDIEDSDVEDHFLTPV